MFKVFDNIVPFNIQQHINEFVVRSNYNIKGWKDRDDLDISKEEILKPLLDQCKIDKNIFFKTIKDPAIKEKLKNATKNAHEKEVFGAPTFIVNNKIFWGQDRLEFALDEYNKVD